MDIEAGLYGVARGERTTFTALYCHLQTPMKRYVLGLLAGDHAIAEDVVNDAFVAIWQQAGHFGGTGSGAGWIRRIVRNKAIDWLRKQRDVSIAGGDQDSIINQIPDPASSAYEAVENASNAQQLKTALGHLSVDHREVIWLCYYEDKSIAQIAQIVECPENTVKTRLFHARKALRDYIDASGLLN